MPCATNSHLPTRQNGTPYVCVDRICGMVFNSVSTSPGTTSVPVTSYSKPFNIRVHTDSTEGSTTPAEASNRGFCLNYVQQPCKSATANATMPATMPPATTNASTTMPTTMPPTTTTSSTLPSLGDESFPPGVDCCNYNECCQKINVTHSNSHVLSIYQNLYGTYSLDGTDSNNHQYYLQDDGGYYGIWWCNEEKTWVIGHSTNMGICSSSSSYASANKMNTCVDTFGYDWKWYDYENGDVLTSAGEGLKIVCVN